MRVLQTLCLLGGYVFFLISGAIVFVASMTSDTALAIYKVWTR